MFADVTVQVADYNDLEHARLIGTLLDDYAADPLGDGVRLKPEIPEKLASCLAAVPGAFSVLAWVGDEPAGVCNCFAGFSTFKCKPLVNVSTAASFGRTAHIWPQHPPKGPASRLGHFPVCTCPSLYIRIKTETRRPPRSYLQIHDCFVRSEFRGAGICGQMLAEVERVALERGCCKITLEVLSENKRAQKAYRRAAFAPYELDPKAGHALFWQKNLAASQND